MAGRVKTGSPELDQVLNGGFPPNTVNIIMGAPGTGKTILSEQLAFVNAARETRALYLTTVSEPLDKFISHGQTYEFFDPGKVGETVFYEDLGLMVRERGAAQLSEIIADLLSRFSPKIVIIDSFKALTELVETQRERRLMMFDLTSMLTVYECTSFLVGEYSDEMMTSLPEFAVADSILLLMKKVSGVREQRFLRVEKLRGANSIPGMHAFNITGRGIEVYPRLLTPIEIPTYRGEVARVQTGIQGLDQLIETGFWCGSTTLIAGPTGVGKTIIGLHFLRQGVLNEEPGVYVGFQENPEQLHRVMHNFGWDLEDLMKSGFFEIMYRSPVEMQLDSVASELFRRVKEGKVKRVVIDALGDLRKSSSDVRRFSDFIYALTQWFAVRNVTCLMTYEIHNLFDVVRLSDEEVSNMSDNIVLLNFAQDEEMRKVLRIIKTRGSSHDPRQHALQITAEGVAVKKER